MEFIRDIRLPGLKLFLLENENKEKCKRWFVFEEKFNDNQYWGESAKKIVACITVFFEKKKIDFHVNDWINEKGVNYRGKGYGAKIMYYIESVLLPLYPDYKININKEETYKGFKKHVEEKIRSCMNIALIGDKTSTDLKEYLEKQGYNKIYTFPSVALGISFLEKNPEIASQLHYVFMQNSSDSYFSGYFYEQLQSIRLNSLNAFVNASFYRCLLPRGMTCVFPYYHFADDCGIFLFRSAVPSRLHSIQDIEQEFFPNLYLDHLSKNPLPIPNLQKEKKEVKKLSDLRILCLLPICRFAYFKEYFSNKGINDISFYQETLHFFRDHINELGQYDIIMGTAEWVEDFRSSSIIDEISKQTKVEGRNQVLVAEFNDAPIYHDETENKVRYTILDEGQKQNVVYGYNYNFEKTIRDDDKNYLHFAIKIETVIREYLDYLNSKGANLPCEDFVKHTSLQKRYEEYKMKIEEEKQKREDFYSIFDSLFEIACAYLREKKVGNIHRKIEEVSIVEKEDYIRVDFLLNGVAKGAINIPKRVQTLGRLCTIELNGKPPRKVCYAYNEEEIDGNIPALNEAELRLLQGLYKRVKTYVRPVVEEVGFVPRKKPRK